MDTSLVELLRNGGYTLYLRHGEATVGEDSANLDFMNCLTQRNLSDTGRMQAMLYGRKFRELRIPISYPVLTSPLCRAIETADLAFGRENVQIEPLGYEFNKLNNSLPAEEQNRILQALQSLLEIKPAFGRNRVIVAHNFPEGVGLGQIPNMGTVIVQPLGRGKGYTVLNKLSLEDFLSLANQR